MRSDGIERVGSASFSPGRATTRAPSPHRADGADRVAETGETVFAPAAAPIGRTIRRRVEAARGVPHAPEARVLPARACAGRRSSERDDMSEIPSRPRDGEDDGAAIVPFTSTQRDAAVSLSRELSWRYRLADRAFAAQLGRGFALEKAGASIGTALWRPEASPASARRPP